MNKRRKVQTVRNDIQQLRDLIPHPWRSSDNFEVNILKIINEYTEGLLEEQFNHWFFAMGLNSLNYLTVEQIASFEDLSVLKTALQCIVNEDYYDYAIEHSIIGCALYGNLENIQYLWPFIYTLFDEESKELPFLDYCNVYVRPLQRAFTGGYLEIVKFIVKMYRETTQREIDDSDIVHLSTWETENSLIKEYVKTMNND